MFPSSYRPEILSSLHAGPSLFKKPVLSCHLVRCGGWGVTIMKVKSFCVVLGWDFIHMSKDVERVWDTFSF